MAHFAHKANSCKHRLEAGVERSAFGVRRSAFGGGVARVWRGRVTLPRDRRSASIKREHAHKRGNEG